MKGLARRTIFLFWALVVMPVCSGAAASRAKWIWSQENPMDNHGKLQVRRFVRDFALDEAPASAEFYVAADDTFSIRVNDRDAGGPSGDGKYRNAPVKFDLTQDLRPGVNRLEIIVTNQTLLAGLIFRGGITGVSGKVTEIYSDASTRIETETGSVPAREVGDATRLPWSTQGHDWRKFMYPDEIDRAERRRQELAMQGEELDRRLLEKESPPRAKIVYRRGMPFFDIDGKAEPVFLYSGWHRNPDDLARGEKLRRLRECGIRIISQNVSPALYFDGEKSDFSEIGKVLRDNLLDVPDGYLFLGINLQPAPEWIKNHPETWIRYADTEPVANAHPLENPAMPSPVSPAYRAHMGQVLRAFFTWLEQQGVGRRVLGVRLDYGVYGEWHWFGMVRNMPDTSPDMENCFREYLRRTYATDAELQQAWRDGSVTRDTATIPGKAERETRTMYSLRDPEKERKVIDFLRCMQDAVTDTQIYFNSIVKETTGNRLLTGNYSGYFFGMTFAAEGWQGDPARALDHPEVDFQAGPYCYDPFRDMGEAGLSRNVTGSYPMRNKLYILEADTRTHLTTETNRNYSADAQESAAQLMRDFCNALFHRSGIWFYDFGYSNWYDDPEIYRTFRTMYDLYAETADCSPVEEIAVVCDFGSIPYQTYSGRRSATLYALLSGSVSELTHSGTPFDMVTFDDLARPGLREHRAYIFLNTVYLTPEKRRIIESLKARGKALAFVYTPGTLTDTGMDISGASELAGMQLRYLHTKADLRMKKNAESPLLPDRNDFRAEDGPLFYVDDPQAETVGYCDVRGRLLVSAAFKRYGENWTLFSAGPLHEAMLREFFSKAGVHVYNESRDVTWVNAAFAAVHTKTAGEKVLRFPFRIREAKMRFPEQRTLPVNGNTLKFFLPANRTAIWEIIQ